MRNVRPELRELPMTTSEKDREAAEKYARTTEAKFLAVPPMALYGPLEDAVLYGIAHARREQKERPYYLHSDDNYYWTPEGQKELESLRAEVAEKTAEIERLKAVIRQDMINSMELMDRSQEAAHYNWLDDQIEKVSAENATLKEREGFYREWCEKAANDFKKLGHSTEPYEKAKREKGIRDE